MLAASFKARRSYPETLREVELPDASQRAVIPRAVGGRAAHDLRAVLRSGSDEDLRKAVERVWLARSDRYSEVRTVETAKLPKAEMSLLGG